jgi:hypothetical protein
MIARPHSQLLVISTMGTLDSELWNQMVARGRDAVEDETSSLAYVEYSAERDEDVFDEAKWHKWMPALGRTVGHADIRAAIEDMMGTPEGPAGVVRAFGNRTTASLVSLFPTEWVEASWRIIKPPERLVLAVDVNDSPAGAAVVSGHLAEDGHGAARVIEWRAGSPRWAIDKVAEVLRDRSVAALVADFGGPAKSIEAELKAVAYEAGDVPVVDRYPRLFGADCQRFYTALKDGELYLEKTPPLEEAIAGAVKKAIGDLWVVSRRQMSADASPLIAAIIAHGLAEELAVTPVVDSFIL